MARRAAMIGILVAGLGGCYGPNHLLRGLDEWGNQMYVDEPWLAQLATYSGVLSLGYIVAGFIDYVFVNPVDFWGKAAASGHGTPHFYQQPLEGEKVPPVYDSHPR
jgi:hypothetical protein